MLILILHGWGSSAKKWQPVKKLLEDGGNKVVIPDLPGFGQSVPPARAWGLDDYVIWLKEFCARENLSQFFLLGHSFGGSIAMRFAAKEPQKLKGLILCSAAGLRAKRKVRKTFIKLAAQTGKAIFSLPMLTKFYSICQKIFYEKILRQTDYLRAKGVMRETLKKVVSEDLTPCLSEIKVQTLIIWGRKDKITPLGDAYLMKEKIPNSRLEILENIKHCPYLEDPKLLAQAVVKFSGTA